MSIWPDQSRSEVSGHKQDAINLLILILVASVLGIYLIVTTILVSKDGVFYIERARGLSSDPISFVKSHPPGYPFLIFAGHEVVTLFTDRSSLFTWIYSAQGTTLLFRLLALVPLYFMGKLLVGGRRSFYGVLILVLLPYPAKMVCDAVRIWPYMVFLSTGFLFLLCGSRRGQWWMFGCAGVAAGVGSIIRPECAQLVIIGALWILIRLLAPQRNMNRSALLCALSVLLLGFGVSMAPYVKVTGKILPAQLRKLMSCSNTAGPDKIEGLKTDSGCSAYAASAVPTRIAEATGRFVERISENLMYYFVPALVIGMCAGARKQSTASDIEKFFIPVFVALNMIMTITVYCKWQYMSRRHCLPVVALTIFYVPAGLEVLTQWFESRFSGGRPQANRHPQLFFFVLVVIGVGICMPKLLRPAGGDKPGYRDAAEWLKSNTDAEDVIAVTDSRIGFYAERRWLLYEVMAPDRADYVVRIVGDPSKEASPDRIARAEYSVPVDGQKSSKERLFIFKM